MTRSFPILFFASVLLTSCATQWEDQYGETHYFDPTQKMGSGQGHLIGAASDVGAVSRGQKDISVALEPLSGAETEPPPKRERSVGTGRFVKQSAPPASAIPGGAGDITLNFDNTDLREVVKVILSDLLDASYVLDPGVQGAVTLQTGSPLRRELLLPTLETLLRMNKAALVESDGMYRVLPIGNAIQGNLIPQLGDSSQPLPRGYSVRIVPLRYVGVGEMSEILKPLAPEGSIVRADPVRNLLVLAGTSSELGSLLDTIDMFDVDWIKGLSVGMFRLEYAQAADVVKQLDTLLGGKEANPLTGLFQMIPLEATNSLLVVTTQESYLQEMGGWIDRLDQAGGEGEGERLFVYRVKNGDAENLATILGQLFADAGDTRRPPPRVAPGLQAASIGTGSQKDAGETAGKKSGASTSSVAGGGAVAAATRVSLGSGINIVADTVNNTLLIRASPVQYRQIRNALEHLDILPLQVLVEATIVEVRLVGDLKYGLQWFFATNHKDKKGNFTLDGTQDDATTSGLGGIFPGFNWSLVGGAGQVHAVLSAFAGDGLINVLSSPSIMVLDNHTAKIQVGDQVPIVTTQQQGVSSTDRVVNSIEYKDTGVLLSVTPRVTPGGLVIMDVEQEVSDVSTASKSSVESPTIQTRNIASSVAVKHAQAVVLGGMIRDIKETSDGGIPGLYQLPVIGGLFGQTTKSASRTELVVILTPRVITNDSDIQAVTDEFRRKLKGLEEKF